MSQLARGLAWVLRLGLGVLALVGGGGLLGLWLWGGWPRKKDDDER